MEHFRPIQRDDINRRQALRFTVAGLASTGVVATSCTAESLRPAHSASQLKSNLGINLAPIRYWSSERPFQNLFQMSSPHVSLKTGGRWNDGGPLRLDDHGWIQSFRNGQYAAFLIDLKRGDPNGEYVVTYQGPPGAIRIARSRTNSIRKQGDFLRINVTVRQPIRDVCVARKGDTIDGVFRESFLQRCQQYGVLRFMDWCGVNEDRDATWNARVTPEHYTQATGEVALEHMLELCRLTQSGMWYCVHHRASDQDVKQAAELIADQLGELPLYVEHSNEVWNGQFPQHRYCRQQNNQQFLAYHVQRTQRIGEIFREVVPRVQTVLGLQCAATWHAEQLLKSTPVEGIDFNAVAPYFGGKLGRLPELVQKTLQGGMDTIVEECRKSIEERRHEIKKHRQLAADRGLGLIGYEGGQHLVAVGQHRRNQRLVDLLIEANRNSTMYELYREYLQCWNEETDGALLCLYNSVGEPSKSGSWGLQEYEAQPAEQAHKYRAVQSLL